MNKEELKTQEVLNQQFKETLNDHAEHLKIANSEMGVIKNDLGVVKNDVVWFREKIESFDKRLDKFESKIWAVITIIVLSGIGQIIATIATK